MGLFGFGTSILFSIFFYLIFGLVITVFIIALVKGIGQWNKNNHAPRLTVPATVVAKRTDVSHHHHHGHDHHHHHTSTSTHYYVTFQVQSGDRIELYLPASEYGYLVEGDCGDLSFQGTRYLGFVRT